MKKLIYLAICLFLLIGHVKAQDGYTHFTFRGGYLYRDAGTISLGFDFAKKYYSSYELTATFIKSNSNKTSSETIYNEVDSTYSTKVLKHSYENLLLGIQYKPLLLRVKNSAVKFRVGAFIGTDWSNFIAAPNLGVEFVQSLSPGVDLTLTNNNGYFFWATKPVRWRNTAEFGIRIAL